MGELKYLTIIGSIHGNAHPTTIAVPVYIIVGYFNFKLAIKRIETRPNDL